MPLGHAATQLVPSLYGLDDEHVTQSVALGPLHALQSLWHASHEAPTA